MIFNMTMRYNKLKYFFDYFINKIKFYFKNIFNYLYIIKNKYGN